MKCEDDEGILLVEDFKPNNGPLLGLEEMNKYLNGTRKVNVQVTTWNSGSLPIPKEFQLRKLFYHNEDDTLKKVDLHVICIQECWPDSDAWELALQTVLGIGYVLFDSVAFGTLHISIFIRRDLIWFTTESGKISTSVRSGRLFKTKGAVGIHFGIFGSRFLFLCAHLSAGNEENRIRQRMEELRKILTTDIFSGTETSSSSTVHHHFDGIFLAGDLNFRILGLNRDRVIDALKRNDIVSILEHDELNRHFYRKDTLQKFFEDYNEAAAITFRPTYKYDIGFDQFDTSNKRRTPAYTDRILYKANHFNPDYPNVVCLAYEAINNMRVSDHKPVFAIFSVSVKPGFDTLPISGAQFNRDVFKKATQLRAKYLLERRRNLASIVCTIS